MLLGKLLFGVQSCSVRVMSIFSHELMSPSLCKIEVFKSWLGREGTVTLVIN